MTLACTESDGEPGHHEQVCMDLARVSQLMHAHVRVLGRYHFALDESAERGGLRPVRDPEAPDEFGPPARH